MGDDFQQLLAAVPLHVLHDGSGDAGQTCTKAGLLPLCRSDGGWQLCVMRPRAERPDLGPPPWQLCKGTRMVRDGTRWRDMQGKDATAVAEGTLEAEALIVTALREAREELGLIASHIETLFELGSREFISASTGKSKKLWMFAALVANTEKALLPMSQVATSTAARKWCGMSDFLSTGRTDHLPIAQDTLTKVQSFLHAH